MNAYTEQRNNSTDNELEKLDNEQLVQIVRDKNRELTIKATEIHDLTMLLEKKQLKIDNLVEALEEIAVDAEEVYNQSQATYYRIRDIQELNK